MLLSEGKIPQIYTSCFSRARNCKTLSHSRTLLVQDFWCRPPYIEQTRYSALRSSRKSAKLGRPATAIFTYSRLHRSRHHFNSSLQASTIMPLNRNPHLAMMQTHTTPPSAPSPLFLPKSALKSTITFPSPSYLLLCFYHHNTRNQFPTVFLSHLRVSRASLAEANAHLFYNATILTFRIGFDYTYSERSVPTLEYPNSYAYVRT